MMSRAAFGGVVWRSELRCSAVKCAPNHGRGNQLYNVYVCRRTVGSFRAVTDRLGERASKILAALASDSCQCNAQTGDLIMKWVQLYTQTQRYRPIQAPHSLSDLSVLISEHNSANQICNRCLRSKVMTIQLIPWQVAKTLECQDLDDMRLI